MCKPCHSALRSHACAFDNRNGGKLFWVFREDPSHSAGGSVYCMFVEATL